jgi:hypothetical protein
MAEDYMRVYQRLVSATPQAHIVADADAGVPTRV